MSGPALPPIGERLRHARLQRGMTVRGLARLVDVSASLISQIETGKSSPSVSTLYAITGALDISIEDVFGDVGERAARRATMANGLPPAVNGAESAPAAPGYPVATDVAAGAVTRGHGGVATAAGSAAGEPGVAAAFAGADMLARTGEGADRSANSPVTQGLRQLHRKRRVGPVVTAAQREMLHLDSGVTWELLGQLPDNHVDFLRITYAPGGSSSGAGVLMRHSGTEWGHVLAGQLTLTLGFDQYVLNPGDSVSFDCSTPHAYANHGTEPAVGVWFVAERFR